MGKFRRKGYRGDTAGFSNPISKGTGLAISDVFGPRPFTPHISTVGYDYDFHRGIDFPDAVEGDPVYAAVTGAVIRRNYSHFHWNEAEQLNEFTEDDTLSALSSTVSGGNLVMTGSRVGVATWPAQAGKLKASNAVIFTNADDWIVEYKLASTISLAGGSVGIAAFNSTEGEYIGLEYDGSTITFRGVGNGGAFLANGNTYAVAGATWLRIEYTQSSDTLTWRHSTDGDSWTDLDSVVGETFTEIVLTPSLYWLSTDTNATDQVISIDEFNFLDESQTVGRFGNWVTIGIGTGKIIQVHLSHVYVGLGEFIAAGQLIGTVGRTGFNVRSGRINGIHVHLEYSDVQRGLYDQDEALNPLDSGLLPRVDVTNNITAAVTNENDPDAVDSWRVRVQVTRADADFDLNTVTFTGNLGSRTVNFNTRAGLNVDNDIPLESGVYIVPEDFDELSSVYECSFYFHRSVVGTTFVSGEVRDTQGNLLATLSFP